MAQATEAPMRNRIAFAAALAALAVATLAQNKSPETGAQPELKAMGRDFFSLPDPKNTVEEAENNLAADPLNPDLLLKLAQAQAAMWQYREAVATCGRGLRIAPENA